MSENRPEKKFAWAVVGAGPGGITAVGLLLDSGVSEKDIVWIDPYFQAGDFGRCWGEVNSNTRVALFLNYLHGVTHFRYAQKSKTFLLDSLNQNGFTQLKVVTDPLLWVSEHLREKVVAVQSRVDSMMVEKGCWQLQTRDEKYAAKKVILATGTEAKSLDFPGVSVIDLVTALTPSELRKNIKSNDMVAVFGSSHSAMIIIRNLVEAGVKKRKLKIIKAPRVGREKNY